MKSFRELFNEHEGNLINKWDHYFDVYDRFFSKYKNKELNILEIGISHGGSLQLWRKYFGEKAQIFAVDINKECERLTQQNTKIFIGSQADPDFLGSIADQMPLLDIIIDDGGHTMAQQRSSFEHLFYKLKNGGIYLVEDTHTSYWREFQGGYKKRNSFIEYSKNIIDALHEWHIQVGDGVDSNEITKHIGCVTFFDSIVIFEKKYRDKPFTIQKGMKTITPYVDPSVKLSVPFQIKKKLFGYIGNNRLKSQLRNNGS